jgi:hypothetical protein
MARTIAVANQTLTLLGYTLGERTASETRNQLGFAAAVLD